MSNIIKKSETAKLFPRRNPKSHKGDNGRVLIIGGSIDYFGAPILAGLGALNSGTDLVYLLVPECNFEVTRSFYPDFIVRKYPGNFINSRILDHIDEFLGKADAVLIGPGVSEESEIISTVARIVKKAKCPVVLDAEAIPAIAQLGLMSGITITPHRGEMDEITEGALPEDFDSLVKTVEDFSKKWGVTILLKGHRDIIAAPDKPARVNETGNAGMTVGGSGDVLAGFTASLIAQHMQSYEACQCAAFLLGLTGDNLYKHKGYNFIATDLALELPYTIHSIVG
ncbi:NAD(P)H-hydrate dehydratase [Candidatus Peregrinibacteria bacterium]|nr:NAD(P)H-hydrate dehydratase [Candidatus Peregrinibacteria bacterium]